LTVSKKSFFVYLDFSRIYLYNIYMLLTKKTWAIFYILLVLVLTFVSVISANAQTASLITADNQLDFDDVEILVELEEGYDDADLYERLDPLTKAENFPLAAAGFPITSVTPSDFTLVEVEESEVFDKVEELEKLPGVKSAQINVPYFPATYTPDDPGFASQWYLDDGNAASIGAQAAWTTVGEAVNGSAVTCSDATPVCGGDSSIVVAVIDTGVNQTLDEFSEVTFTNPAAFEYKSAPCSVGETDVLGKQTINGYMCRLTTQNDDCTTSTGATVTCGHGTQVASIIAMDDDTTAGIGLAYNVQIMPISIKGAFDTLGVAKAVEYAKDNGADVINMSIAAPVSDTALQQEIQEAHAAGVTLVASSGNCGDSFIGGSGCFANIPQSSIFYNLGGPNPDIYPAFYDQVVSVGALNGNNTRSDYSTFNERVDIAAPVGTGVYTIYREGTVVQTSTNVGGEVVSGVGTSFAAPQVAAGIALAKSVDSTLTNTQIDRLIEFNSTDVEAIGFDEETGWGRLNILGMVSAPVTAVTSPTTGTSVFFDDGDLTVTATAADGDGISSVDFYNGSTLLGSDTTAPYTYTIPEADLFTGTYDIYSMSTDANGNSGISEAIEVTVSENWIGWSQSGKMLSPSNSVEFGSELIQTVRGSDGTMHIRRTSDGINWSGWQRQAGATIDRPDTVNFTAAGRLVQTVRGNANWINTRYSNDGVNWSGWVQSGKMLSPASTVEFNGQLIQTVRGSDGTMHIRRTSDGINWSGWQRQAGATIDAIDTVVFTGQNRIVQTVRGNGDWINTRYSNDGVSWSNWSQSGKMLDTSSTIEFNNLLIQTVRGSGNTIHMRTSTDGITWTGWTQQPGNMLSPSADAIFNNRHVQTVRGSDNTIYIRYSNDGSTYSQFVQQFGATPDDIEAISFNGQHLNIVRSQNSDIAYRYR
jgi:hypothetical protein